MWFFLYLSGLRHRSRISISFSDEVIEQVERRRGLVKFSIYYESLIRSALDMELEENRYIKRNRVNKSSFIMMKHEIFQVHFFTRALY